MTITITIIILIVIRCHKSFGINLEEGTRVFTQILFLSGFMKMVPCKKFDPYRSISP